MSIKAKSLFYIGLLFWSAASLAQNITKSPYSSIGLGELQFSGSAQLHGMGQIAQGVRLPSLLNNQNPAAYSSLQQTVWDVGGLGSIGTVTSKTGLSGANTASFAYMSVGFRLSQKKGWGLSFGLMPYTGIGYNVTRNVVTPTFEGTEVTEGRGGLSKFYIGTGTRVNRTISVGVNAGYLFGQVSQITLLKIPTQYNMYNLIENRDRYLNGFQFDLGVQYADTFTKFDSKKRDHHYQYGFGLTVTPQVGLNGSDNNNVRTLGVGVTNSSSIGKDTVANQNEIKGTVVMPMIIKGGVFFQETNHWGIGVDLSYQAWSNYRAYGSSDSLKNTVGVNVGAYYKHNKSNSKSYFNKVEYRVGLRYDNGTISSNGYNVSTTAFSVGLGLPIDKIVSKLNLSAEYLLRGTTENSLIKEEYFRFVIGVSISDNQWFRRYKYD